MIAHKDNLPRLLTMDDAAARLNVSRRWVQGFLRGRPLGRMAGRKRLFTESDLARIIEELPCPSSSSSRAKAGRKTGASGDTISASTWIGQQKQRIAELRRGCSQDGETRSNVVRFQDGKN